MNTALPLPTVPQSSYTPAPHCPNKLPSLYAALWIINVISSTCALPAMTCKMSTGDLPLSDNFAHFFFSYTSVLFLNTAY